jgi:hypothetical protein
MHCAHITVIVRAGRYHAHKPCECPPKEQHEQPATLRDGSTPRTPLRGG